MSQKSIEVQCQSGWCTYRGKSFLIPLVAARDIYEQETPFVTALIGRCLGCGYEPRVINVPEELNRHRQQ